MNDYLTKKLHSVAGKIVKAARGALEDDIEGVVLNNARTGESTSITAKVVLIVELGPSGHPGHTAFGCLHIVKGPRGADGKPQAMTMEDLQGMLDRALPEPGDDTPEKAFAREMAARFMTDDQGITREFDVISGSIGSKYDATDEDE